MAHYDATGKSYNKNQQSVLALSNTFDDFILNCANVVSRSGATPFKTNQFEYLTGADGKVCVDFIGKFESFEKELKSLFNKIGLSEIEIPHLNKSKRNDYRDCYSLKTRNVVARRFKKDIEFFGYEF